MFEVWKEIYRTLYQDDVFFLVAVACACAGDFFRWRYRRTGRQTSLLALLSFYGLAALNLLAVFAFAIIFYGDFAIVIWSVIFMYCLYWLNT